MSILHNFYICSIIPRYISCITKVLWAKTCNKLLSRKNILRPQLEVSSLASREAFLKTLCIPDLNCYWKYFNIKINASRYLKISTSSRGQQSVRQWKDASVSQDGNTCSFQMYNHGTKYSKLEEHLNLCTNWTKLKQLISLFHHMLHCKNVWTITKKNNHCQRSSKFRQNTRFDYFSLFPHHLHWNQKNTK